MIYLKHAGKWNLRDIVAANYIRYHCGGGWIPWRHHAAWWFRGAHERCWFALSSWGKRVGYVRADKGGYVSIAILEPWRRNGLGHQLLREVRSRVPGVLLAVIKRENIASRALFFRAGYQYIPSAKGSEYVMMKHEGK